MDPFGIFELLDTLSALTSGQNPAEQKEPAPETKQRVSPEDKVFSPPEIPGQPANGDPAKNLSAIESLYERHDKISRKIDKNK